MNAKGATESILKAVDDIFLKVLFITNFNSRVEPQIIRAGVVTLGDNTWHDESDYRIAQNIPHPNYTHSSKYNDIALLRFVALFFFKFNT